MPIHLAASSHACSSDRTARSRRGARGGSPARTSAQQLVESAAFVVCSGATAPRAGLFTRGLGTRLGTNALQASIFTVIWKLAEEQMMSRGL